MADDISALTTLRKEPDRIATPQEMQVWLKKLQIEIDAVRFVLAERERELLEEKGPCSNQSCPLHYAHAGPCKEGSV